MRYLLLLLPLFLFGCADSSTTGTSRTYDIQVNIHDNWGPVTLDFPLQVDAQSANEQVTENASDIAPDLRLQLTEGGATGSMAGADSTLKDITSKAKATIEKIAAEKVKESLPIKPEPKPEPIPTPEQPPVVEPEDPPVEDPPVVDPPKGREETYQVTSFANGRQAFRLPSPGKDYSVPLMITFESGHQRTTMDVTSRWEDEDGTLFRPGTGKVEPGDPNKDQNWTSHGGIFIHAPYGDESTHVTLKEIMW